MTTTLPIGDFQRKEPTRESEDVLSAPFFFELPTSQCMPTESHSVCCEKAHGKHSLPPSFKLGGRHPASSMALNLRICEIKYSIAATLWREEDDTARTSLEWNYMPITTEAPPSITVTDFPGEYQLYTKALAADFRRLKFYGQVAIHIEEPDAVLIGEDDICTVKAIAIPARLCLYPLRSGLDNAEKPDIGECECMLSLETDTFASTSCQGEILPQVNKIPPLVVSQRREREPQRVRLPISPWNRTVGTEPPTPAFISLLNHSQV
jgi:hypothetical protein